VQSRTEFLATLVPPDSWFCDAGDEDEAESDDDASEDADRNAEEES
jgi:hypothetical protein